MGLLKSLTRRKALAVLTSQQSELGRVLTTLDLTALGVGSTLGVGIYVLAGAVSKDTAGPGVVLSFLFAAIASVLAGLCFAELGARVPKAGSAYTYSYVTIGEFVAFIIGWVLIMEYIIGGAGVARGLSIYLDSLFGHRMEAYFRGLCEIDVPFLSEYIDIFAFTVSVALASGLAMGLKESMVLNNLLTTVNVTVVLFVIIVGSFKADPSNWQIPSNEVPTGAGKGGFLPYGLLGAIKGAATCFFGYVGFDCISTTGEEVKNPQRAIPIAIILSLAISFLAYFGVSAVLTLMWPYYLQDPGAPIPFVFSQVGWNAAKWIVAVGAVFGLFASLIGGLFPLPRIIYAMANDGLLFRSLGKIHPTFKTPFVGTMLSGVVTGMMAAIFRLKHLVDLMSIGTLLVYTIVAAAILFLRYRDEEGDESAVTHEYVEHTHLLSQTTIISCRAVIGQLFNWRALDSPTSISAVVVTTQTVLFCVLTTLLAGCLVHGEEALIAGSSALCIVCAMLAAAMAVTLVSISLQPAATRSLSFKVPFVPVLPALSIFINIYLMLLMDLDTWFRFSAWLLIGVVIYFSYGLSHSSERLIEQKVEYDSLENGGTERESE